MNVQFDSLRTIRRELKKKQRATKDSLLSKKYDAEINSITEKISKRRDEFKAKGITFEESKQSKIINAFLDLIELEINDSDIKSDIDCYFFQYQNNNEKGIMCLYPMDSLSLGKHDLNYFKEKRTQKENRNNDVTIKTPFYKVRNKN